MNQFDQSKPTALSKKTAFRTITVEEHFATQAIGIVELAPDKKGTLVMLMQGNNPDEEARQHSEQNWGTMLSSLKNLIEKVR